MECQMAERHIQRFTFVVKDIGPSEDWSYAEVVVTPADDDAGEQIVLASLNKVTGMTECEKKHTLDFV